jgi:hypothetical protein
MQPTPSYPPQMYPPPAAPPASSTHVLGGVLMLVSALLILLGLVTKSFVTASREDNSVGIGYLGAEVCSDGHCQSFDWDQMGSDVKSDIKAVRWLGLIAGVGAIGLAVVAGIFAFQRKKFPGVVLHSVLGVAAFAFVYFVLRWIAETHGDISPLPGLSFALAFSGVILASVMQATVLRGIAGRR